MDFIIHGFEVRPDPNPSSISKWIESVFIDCNRGMGVAFSPWAIQSLNLNFDPAHGQRHAALGDPPIAIAVNGSSQDLFGIPIGVVVGILGHEYGHVFYKPASSIKATRDEELKADKFSGYVLGLHKMPTDPIERFLTTHSAHRSLVDYPTLPESIAGIRCGHQRALLGLQPEV